MRVSSNGGIHKTMNFSTKKSLILDNLGLYTPKLGKRHIYIDPAFIPMPSHLHKSGVPEFVAETNTNIPFNIHQYSMLKHFEINGFL